MPVTIIRKFRGLFDTWNLQSESQGLDNLGPCTWSRTYNPVSFTKAEFVIRDQRALDRFIARVPKAKMQFVADPEPNDDPILYCREIDFATQMLVSIVFHDPNRFIDLDIESVELMSDTMRVICHYQPGPVQAKVISFGCYCAVVVGRVD